MVFNLFGFKKKPVAGQGRSEPTAASVVSPASAPQQGHAGGDTPSEFPAPTNSSGISWEEEAKQVPDWVVSEPQPDVIDQAPVDHVVTGQAQAAQAADQPAAVAQPENAEAAPAASSQSLQPDAEPEPDHPDPADQADARPAAPAASNVATQSEDEQKVELPRAEAQPETPVTTTAASSAKPQPEMQPVPAQPAPAQPVSAQPVSAQPVSAQPVSAQPKAEGQLDTLKATREDVIAAYKIFLGRQPESMEVVDPRVGVTPMALLVDFLASKEFLDQPAKSQLVLAVAKKILDARQAQASKPATETPAPATDVPPAQAS